MNCYGCEEKFVEGDDVSAWFSGEVFCESCRDGMDRPHLFEQSYIAEAE